MSAGQELHLSSNIEIKLHALEQRDTFLSVSVLQDVPASKKYTCYIMGPKVFEKFVPCVSRKGVLDSSDKIIAKTHLVTVDRHVKGIDSALGIRDAGGLLFGHCGVTKS